MAASLPRVITVSSGGMLTQKLDVSDLMTTKVSVVQRRVRLFTDKYASRSPVRI